jgi:hypothetical protein
LHNRPAAEEVGPAEFCLAEVGPRGFFPPAGGRGGAPAGDPGGGRAAPADDAGPADGPDPDWVERWGWELAGLTGLDPTDRTLRELLWAADGRLESDWWRGAYLTAIQVAAAGGKVADLNDLVPPRYRRPPPPKTAEQKARDTRNALRLMGSFFRDPEA